MVHCGHEPSAVNATFRSIEGFWSTAKRTLFGLDSDKGRDRFYAARRHAFRGNGRRGHAKRGAHQGDQRSGRFPSGDVTLTLADGTKQSGYIFNADDRIVENSSPRVGRT